MTFSYADYSSYDKARDALEDMYAAGQVSECEVYDIKRRGNRWHILLWG